MSTVEFGKEKVISKLTKRRLGFLLISLFFPFSAYSFEISNPCTNLESVKFPSTVLPQWREAFFQSVLGKASDPSKIVPSSGEGKENYKANSALALAHAFTLRKRAQSEAEKAFSEYWIARALFLGKQQHLSHRAFSQIVFKKENLESVSEEPGQNAAQELIAYRNERMPIRLAALECAIALMRANPALEWPSQSFELITHLGNEYSQFIQSRSGKIANDEMDVLNEALLFSFEQSLADGRSIGDLGTHLENWERIFSKKANSSVDGQPQGKGSELKDISTALFLTLSTIRGFQAAKAGNHETALKLLQPVAEAVTHPSYIKTRLDSVFIQVARSAFSVKKYDLASNTLRKVSKQNNDLAQSLSELSWAYLQNQQYGESIGAAINLQQGGLRTTFEPEAPMVMAMAYNELCQYPDSIRAIEAFQKSYRKEYEWLSSWNKDRSRNISQYYPKMIAELKSDSQDNRRLQESKEAGQKIPAKIMGEWLRHPYFLAAQEDINFWIKDERALREVRNSAENRFSNTLIAIASLNAKLKTGIPRARARLKAGEDLPFSIRYELSLLKDKLIELERLKSLAPLWSAIEKANLAQSEMEKKKRVVEINKKIELLNKRMFLTLEEIADNLQLVEVEIYNSATQDIIWQNANPEYAQVAKELKENSDRSAAENEWHWGRTIANIEDPNDPESSQGEVWEDELGNFRANLVDNCSNKERFADLKSLRSAKR